MTKSHITVLNGKYLDTELRFPQRVHGGKRGGDTEQDGEGHDLESGHAAAVTRVPPLGDTNKRLLFLCRT